MAVKRLTSLSTTVNLSLVILLLFTTNAICDSLYGCVLNDQLCNSNEYCVNDELLGECATSASSVKQLTASRDQAQVDLFLQQLAALDTQDLKDLRVQCKIAYFKLVSTLELEYDPEFCDVHNPENIWKLLLSAKAILSVDEPHLNEIGEIQDLINAIAEGEQAVQSPNYASSKQELDDAINKDENINALPEFTDTEPELISMESDNDNNDQSLPDTIIPSDLEIENKYGEEEKEQLVNLVDGQAPVLKKDVEFLGDQNTGLEKIEHKIVKGTPTFQKVDGNRVYLKVKQNLNEDQLYQLIDYLDHSIALPNKLIFSDFELDGDQLSFRASRLSVVRPRAEKRLESVEGIAEAVYKRRKDIETMSGVRVDETGIGSGQESIPVESVSRDHFSKPILVVSAFTISTMLIVLIAHQLRQYRRRPSNGFVSHVGSTGYDPKSPAIYQDLFRNRIGASEGLGNENKKLQQSNISFWCDEPMPQSNIDISTGHVILSFLRKYLTESLKIEEQWKALQTYSNVNGKTTIGEHEENRDKNTNQAFLPYDDALVLLQSPTSTKYINASPLYDSNPKQPNYIVTQTPLANTLIDFWQMVWQQGIVLIVNLANEDDAREKCFAQYWPENGSHVYGFYEIHLVSEHIWSEDYLVRSFYLKNLKTNETRTVTQFHFLTWPKGGVPSSPKVLRDFRRKINKSYRGRAAPILVHSSEGAGRSGTYCLLDMELNRVATGVKELNIAGSLEHLRDQRGGLIESSEQYKIVFVCLADEITAMIDALQR